MAFRTVLLLATFICFVPAAVTANSFEFKWSVIYIILSEKANKANATEWLVTSVPISHRGKISSTMMSQQDRVDTLYR